MSAIESKEDRDLVMLDEKELEEKDGYLRAVMLNGIGGLEQLELVHLRLKEKFVSKGQLLGLELLML
jgi:hypothetical protein